MSSVTDGASNTLLIGEDVPELNWHSTAYYANGSWCSCNVPLNFGMSIPSGQLADTFAYNWIEAQGFRSRHPGGVHFSRADGSVDFFAESMDNAVYRTSCTRNGDDLAVP